jgi:CheY-like chemotaxis protein
MVYNTVKAHNGHLDLASQPGLGTRVTLRFPSFQGRSALGELQPGPGDEPGGLSLHVLLVDDDELIRSSLESVLEALGHSTTATASGEEALLLLGKGFQPDLVIMDMNMPGLGGAGTLPRLREQWPAVPVLLSTGRADQSVLDLLAAHPQVSLLSKPFTMKELEAHLKRAGHT